MAFVVSSSFTSPSFKFDPLQQTGRPLFLTVHKPFEGLRLAKNLDCLGKQGEYQTHSQALTFPANSSKAGNRTPRVTSAVVGNGLFTQGTPEVRRISPERNQGLPSVKIVYVVLEAQYQASVSAAVRNLNQKRKDVSFEIVGYLLEELRDQSTYNMFCKDLSDANIFIGSLIFVEELAQKVKAAVETERERLDAVLVFPSMPEVMRLNKLGSFSMSQLGQSKSPFFQMFKRKKKSAGFEESMLKLVRTLPKVLKYLPSDKAQDARAYIMSLQFWLGGSPENLENFFKMIAGSYVPALKKTKLEFVDPVVYLDTGIWHPLAPCMYDDVKEYLNWYDTRKDAHEKLKNPNAPVIGIALQRSHIITGDDGHYVAVVMELEARGAKVVPIFSGGLDFSTPVERFLYDPLTKKSLVDAVVSLTGFALVGGPARQDHPRAIQALSKLDVPYIVALPLVFQTTEEWLISTLGLHPIQVALQVALPELDGGLEPIVFSGRDARTGKSHALHKRVEQLCTRAIKWAQLKRIAKEDKKIAITVFSFPPDKGNVGTAAYLNVFASIFSVLQELKKDGYNLEGLPNTSEALIEDIIHDKEAKFSSPNLNIAYKMNVREYQQLTPYAKALEENWGKPPGNLNSDGENLLVYGKQFGNVFIGVQPTFGYEGDPMRLLFAKSASPHHGFAAYYSFLDKIFKADAVLHFGTHGSLEFMPGKQVGMSDVCYPDSLIGNIPNIYYYAANNPSEATIAKRRSYANTISYLTPPAENAGLYKGLKQLSELIASYQSLKDSGRGTQIVNSIISTAKQCNLDKDIALPEEGIELPAEERDSVVGRVYSKIMEIESRLLPCGLHVIGQPPSAMEAVATLVNIAALDRPEDEINSLPGILAEAVYRNIEDIYRNNDSGILKDVELLKQITDASRGAISAFVDRTTNKKGQVVNVADSIGSFLGFGRKEPWIEYLEKTKFRSADQDKLRTLFGFLSECLKLVVADNELGGLKQALEGCYVLPGPGGDPIRNPKVLPTGKNIHALDPQAIPTVAAMQSAKVVVERLLERQKADNDGKYPETIALVLWGTDNIKTYGESLAQVLWMVGAKPVADALGRVNKVEPVPLEELGRPRIDVVVNCSGVFRDLFINQMNLLDRAIKMVAELDEPLEMNYVRKHASEQAQTLGIEVREAATRVFSNASGSYSSNVNLAVENSSWNDEKQLQDMYVSRKSFAFDSDAPGAGMKENKQAFEMALSTAEATFQNLDSSEISLTDVSHYFDSDPTNLVQSLRKDKKKPNAYIADTTTANACGVFDGHGPYGHMVAKRVRDSLPSKLCSHWEALTRGDEGNNNIREAGNTAGSLNSDETASITMDEEWKEAEGEDTEGLAGKAPDMLTAWKESFLKAFKVMDKELRFHPTIDCFCSGTTAVTLLKQGEDLVMGNVGDSRAVLATRDDDSSLIAVQLTVDLKPNLPKEAERIKQFKGRVFALQDEPDVARVWLPHDDSPGLAMARAFGDFCLKDFGLIAVPDISYRRLTQRDEFIVLATDGVWDVLSNKEVVDIVASAPTQATAARSLVEFAVRAWRLKYPTSKVDDCAVVCLFLSDPPSITEAKASKDMMLKEPLLPKDASPAPGKITTDEYPADGEASSPRLGRLNTVRINVNDVKNRSEAVSEIVETSTTDLLKQPERSQSRRSLADCLSVADEDEWSALEGVSRVNSLLNLPRFLTGDRMSGGLRKRH